MANGRSGRQRIGQYVALALVIVLVGWNYLHDAYARKGGFTLPEPDGYYGLLGDALASGQFHVKLTPEPAFLRLENPYAGPQGTSRPHDMSYYKGRFYVYYGVAPALIVTLPIHLLTGRWITEPMTTSVLCFAGFLLGTLWLVRMHRQHAPGVKGRWLVLCVALWGFGNPVYFVANNDTFYAVPIAGAFCALMGAIVAVERALRAVQARVALFWLAVASLAMALAVGSRPHYILALPMLLLVGWFFWRQEPREARWRWLGLRWLMAAVGPAALVGAWLAYYNYARFDNPFDFGIQYALGPGDQRAFALTGLQYIPKNLYTYLLRPADFVDLFPFILTNVRPFGVVPHYPWALGLLLLPWAVHRFSLGTTAAGRIGTSFVGGCTLATFAGLCLFFGEEDRYLVDFAPGAILATSAVVLALLQRGRNAPGRRLIHTLIVGVAVWTLFNGVMIGFMRRAPSPAIQDLELQVNRLVHSVASALGREYGPLEMQVIFPRDALGTREPLLTTGHIRGTGDIVWAEYLNEQQLRFGFFHLGIGGPSSEPIQVEYGRPYTLTIHLGSLYPSDAHPIFQEWAESDVRRLRRKLEVRLDDDVVLSGRVQVYPSSAGGVRVGENQLANDVTAPAFTGRITNLRRRTIEVPSPVPWRSGPVRLTVQLSPHRDQFEPLISTGRRGAGDLLNVQLQSDGRIRFMHDSWDRPEVVTSPVSLEDLRQPQMLEIEMGSLYPPDAPGVTAAQRRRLAIWINGQEVIDVDRAFHPAEPDEVEFGVNGIGGGSSSGMFGGSILNVERIAPREPPELSEAGGPVGLRVRFPRDVSGGREPLLTCGWNEDAGILFVEYRNDGLAFGYARGGKILALTTPIPLDLRITHDLVLEMDALRSPSPPLGSETTPANVIRIHLNNRRVLETQDDLPPAAARHVHIGRNDANSTAVGRYFSGQILEQTRPD